jgi:hypothetical protein
LGLGGVKTLWQKSDRGFPAPEPFTIIGQRELAYRRWLSSMA